MLSFLENLFGGKRNKDMENKILQAQAKKSALYDSLLQRDNRESDMKSLYGTALNDMAKSGVINSSVGKLALGEAAAKAEDNYWKDKLSLLKENGGLLDNGYYSTLEKSRKNTNPLNAISSIFKLF